MEREAVLRWFEEHPDSVQGEPQEIVARCERAVRRHAREEAWLAAKRYVAHCQLEWQQGSGSHASEAYVARQVCEQLAYRLRRHEPTFHPGDEDRLAGGPVKAAVGREGWALLTGWIEELAHEQEHETWEEIVRYTQCCADELIRSHQLSDDSRYESSACFGETAARIADILARDYSAHAFPR